MKLNDKVYDVLKYIAQIFLPAFITFLGIVLQCLHYPNTEVVMTIMVAFNTFLGAILGISTINYKKGSE